MRVVGLLVMVGALALWSPFGSSFGLLSADAVVDDQADPEDRVSPAGLPALDAGGEREALPDDRRLMEAKEVDPPERIEPVDLDAKRPPVPDFSKVDQERSSPAQLVWETSPGVFVAESAAVPKWFKGGDGRWAPIDVSVVPVEGFPGAVSTRAGPWSATFAPIGGAAGGVSVVAEDGDMLSWRPAGVAAAVVPQVSADGLTVTYREVWPGVDLRYRLSTVGVSEEVVLSSSEVQVLFGFEVDQRLVRDGVAEAEASKLERLPEAQRRVPRFSVEGVDGIELGAPKVVSADGRPLSEAPVVSLAADALRGSMWTVGVDAEWMRAQPAEAFPLVLDPDVVFTSFEVGALRWLDMRNGGAFCGWNYPGVPDFC